MPHWVDARARSLRIKFYMIGTVMILGALLVGLALPLYPYQGLSLDRAWGSLYNWRSAICLYIAVLGIMFINLANTEE
jgi:hypothetical protein